MTNGLVGSAALALCAVVASASYADGEVQFASDAEFAGYDNSDYGAYSDGDVRWRTGPYLFAGAEATFLSVDAPTGGEISLSFSDTTAPGVASISFLDGDGVDQFGFAPRLWLGYQLTDKWGVVGRYWSMNASQFGFPTLAPGTTPVGSNFATIEETSRCRLYTVDLEGVRSLQVGDWKFDASVGARHASYRTHSEIFAFGVFTTGNFVNLTLQNGLDFDGAGVTTSLVGRRAIGQSTQLFAGGRMSFLAGQSDAFGRSAGSVADSPSAPLVGAATVRRNDADATLVILETQVGIQWDFPLYGWPATAFFRTAFEYQYWDLGILPTGGAGFGGTIGELTTNSFSTAPREPVNAHLCGVSIAAGYTW